MIDLARERPLTIGNLRVIYPHPADTSLLIKIMRADAVARRWNAPGRWHKRLTRARQYTGFVRELKEYISLHARYPQGQPPIVRLTGIVETDLGLGLVCEKIVADDGALGPSMRALYLKNGGASAQTDLLLDRFITELLEFDMIVGDLHPGNLVYGSDSRGGPRLILVDGFGEKKFIPLNSMSRALNRKNTLHLYRRLRSDLQRPVATWGPPVRDI